MKERLKMANQTVDICNVRDGLALSQQEATALAKRLRAGPKTPWATEELVAQVCNILLGRRRDAHLNHLARTANDVSANHHSGR
jgi:hypothetical protein